MASEQDRRAQRLDTFRALVSERIAKLNVSWIQLEQGVGEHNPSAEMRGTLHTLKGEAALLGFRSIADIAHALEDLIDALAPVASQSSDGGEPMVALSIEPTVGQQVLDAFDLIETFAEREPSDELPPQAGAMLAALAAAVANTKSVSERVPVSAAEVAGRGAPGPSSASAASARPAAGAGAAESATPVAPATVQTSARANAAPTSAITAEASAPTPLPVSERDLQPRSRSTYSVRVRPAQLDRMRDIIAELLIARTRLSLGAVALHAQRYGLQRDLSGLGGDRAGSAPGVPDEPSDSDDVLRSIEGELRENVVRMSTLITALDEVTRELRMVPISVLFDRYPLAVRNMSRELGLQVTLDSSGAAVEADRDVLEALDAPILHLVRNALDHGIETPEQRRAAGKPEAGKLTLRAHVASDTLHVEVIDDGAGVDVDEVRRAAIKRGVLDPATAHGLPEAQVLQCLFMPGLSTRANVTAMSGRGVGLDVVQQTVRNLGGTIELRSVLGLGTVFHLAVPIRAAITSVLVFRVGRGWYALPSSELVALVAVGELDVVARLDGQAIRYEGALVPLIALESVLDQEPTEAAERDGERIIVVRDRDRLLALTGSYGHTQREAILDSVSALMGEHTLISAGLGLENGEVALVLNTARLASASAASLGSSVSRTRALASVSAEGVLAGGDEVGRRRPAARVPLVLVAEDSPMIRDLVASALRSHGVRVVEASDGREALERLDELSDVDLLITDIEMPRLDGLGLITALRARSGPRIPAIVVSTRGSDDDKLAAVEVGADAYLVKNEFSQAGLWSIVSRFLG